MSPVVRAILRTRRLDLPMQATVSSISSAQGSCGKGAAAGAVLSRAWLEAAGQACDSGRAGQGGCGSTS